MRKRYAGWVLFLGFVAWAQLLHPSVAYAQQEGANWHFGKQAGLSFTSGAPVPLERSSATAYEGSTAISTPTGQLLFYSNGEQVWDATHQVLPNGAGLGGHNSATQTALLLPVPGSSTRYYLFTVDAIDNNLVGGLRYSLLDASLHGGLGDVVAGSKAVRLPTPTLTGKVTEKLTAALHTNGRDYWVVVHGWQSNEFYSFLVSPDGLSAAPVVSAAGPVHQGGSSFNGASNAIGYMRISPNGAKLALAQRDTQFELYDFNAATGEVTNFSSLTGASNRYYGIEFSPDNSRLYTTMYSSKSLVSEIYQYDLLAGSAAAIQSSAQVVGSVKGLSTTIQAGPDGKIYVSVFEKPYLNVIANPNALGAAAGFCENSLPLGTALSQNGLPNFPNAFPANAWTGTVSTAFAEPANWSKKVAPGANDDVIIRAAAGRMPVLSTEATVRNLTIESGASLTDNGSLTLRGNLVSKGTFTGIGTLRSVGSGQHAFGGAPLHIGSLVAGPSSVIQLAGPVKVQHLLRLDGNLTTNGYPLTLLANARGAAIVVNGAGAVTGAVTVQRYVATHRSSTKVLHLATPVQLPARASVAVDFTATAFPLNPGSGSAPAELVAGQGYAAQATTNTLSFTGELHNGAYQVTGPSRDAANPNGWWLLGNPYPAPIAWDQVLRGATGLDAAVYTLTAEETQGPWASFVRGIGVNGGSNVIPLGQGFVVRTSRAATTGSVTFTNQVRLTTLPASTPASGPRTQLELELKGASGATQAAVYFEAGASAGFDPAFDACQLPAGGGLQLAISAGTEQLAIQGLPLLGTRPVGVNLLVRVPAAGKYILRTAQLRNVPAGVGVYLRDAETGATIDLQQQSAYVFAATRRAVGARFSLLFAAPAPASLPAASLLAAPAELVKKAVGVQLYNLVDETVEHFTLSPRTTATLELALAGLVEGIYVVQVLSRLGTMNQRRRLGQNNVA